MLNYTEMTYWKLIPLFILYKPFPHLVSLNEPDMLVDIFSVFDDCQNKLSILPLVWLAPFILFFSPMISPYFITPDTNYHRKSLILSLDFKGLGQKIGGFILFAPIIYSFIVLANLTGLMPYFFSVTRHLAFSLALSLPLWLAFIISSFVKAPYPTTASFLPMGAPAPLNPFLSLVELVSISVRPLTLAVRLVANISAGHIVLGLVGTYLSSALFLSFNSSLLLISIQVFYTMFEVAIALIQAYIFTLLLTLYLNDHQSILITLYLKTQKGLKP